MRYRKRKHRENNYGIVQKHAAKKGVAGLIIGIIAAGLFAWFLVLSASSGGNLKPIMGALTIALFGAGGLGLWLAVQSFHEIDKNYTVSRIAVGINAVLMFVIFIVFVLGLR